MSIANFIEKNDLFYIRSSKNDYVALAMRAICHFTDLSIDDITGGCLVNELEKLDEKTLSKIDAYFKSALDTGKFEAIEKIKRDAHQVLTNKLGSAQQQINVHSAMFLVFQDLLTELCANAGMNYRTEVKENLEARGINLDIDELTENAIFLNQFLYGDVSALKAETRRISDKSPSSVKKQQAKNEKAFEKIIKQLN